MQEDIFYNCENCRLKLRVLSLTHGELIYYERQNKSGPKTSDYVISITNEPKKLNIVLEKAYGIRAVVKKSRNLFMFGRTRIHVDTVEGLGNYVELEVVLEEGEDESVGVMEAEQIMKLLEIEKADLIEDAYVDLLSRRME